MSGGIQHSESNTNVGRRMTHDPTGCFHVDFCHNITGTTTPLFDTENWGNMCECICTCMQVCACLSDLPALLFLFMIGGVSANRLLIHHPAATGLSCDWALHTLPSAKRICRPKLNSYRLWQGHRAVWHNIIHMTHSHTDLCLDEFTLLTHFKTEMCPTALQQPYVNHIGLLLDLSTLKSNNKN